MKRILLVEDELEFRLIIQLMLELLGCQVDCAPDGQAAIEMACQGQYDCILMDIGLPKLDGIKACKAIKQHQSRENTFPKALIVALTESAQIEHLDKCIEAGMTTVLFKPLKSGPLQRLINSLDFVK
jgi:CheY-like chemotaxis protein